MNITPINVNFVLITTIMSFCKSSLCDYYYCSEERLRENQHGCMKQLQYSWSAYFKDTKKQKVCRCSIGFTEISGDSFNNDVLGMVCLIIRDLKELNLGNIKLRQINNDVFENHPSLLYLNLSFNNMNLNFSNKANNLEELDLSHNSITNIENEAFIALRSLRILNMSHNGLKKIGFSFKGLTFLEELDLSHNDITSLKHNELVDSRNLKVLKLGFNGLELIENYGFLQNLRELKLNNNKIKHLDMIELRHILKFDISNNLIEEFTNHKMNMLKELNAEGNQIKTVDKNVFMQSPELKNVNIANNRIYTIEPDAFTGSSKIENLDLSRNNLHEIKCSDFESLTVLLQLELSYNQISQLYNCSLMKQMQLESLNLFANQLEGVPPGAFTTLEKLRILNLGKNKIKSLSPYTLSHLNNLEALNISYNQLKSFKLREQLGKKLLLKNLDLTYNRIKEPEGDLDLDLFPLLHDYRFHEKNVPVDVSNAVNKYLAMGLPTILTIFIAAVIILFFIKRMCKRKRTPIVEVNMSNK